MWYWLKLLLYLDWDHYKIFNFIAIFVIFTILYMFEIKHVFAYLIFFLPFFDDDESDDYFKEDELTYFLGEDDEFLEDDDLAEVILELLNRELKGYKKLIEFDNTKEELRWKEFIDRGDFYGYHYLAYIVDSYGKKVDWIDSSNEEIETPIFGEVEYWETQFDEQVIDKREIQMLMKIVEEKNNLGSKIIENYFSKLYKDII